MKLGPLKLRENPKSLPHSTSELKVQQHSPLPSRMMLLCTSSRTYNAQLYSEYSNMQFPTNTTTTQAQ